MVVLSKLRASRYFGVKLSQFLASPPTMKDISLRKGVVCTVLKINLRDFKKLRRGLWKAL